MDVLPDALTGGSWAGCRDGRDSSGVLDEGWMGAWIGEAVVGGRAPALGFDAWSCCNIGAVFDASVTASDSSVLTSGVCSPFVVFGVGTWLVDTGLLTSVPVVPVNVSVFVTVGVSICVEELGVGVGVAEGVLATVEEDPTPAMLFVIDPDVFERAGFLWKSMLGWFGLRSIHDFTKIISFPWKLRGCFASADVPESPA